MKKVVTKTTQKGLKKESELELLARLVKDRFERMDKQFERIEKKFEQIDRRFEKVESHLFSIKHELRDHTVRLDSIERKQGGIRLSLDKTMHVSEFKAPAK